MSKKCYKCGGVEFTQRAVEIKTDVAGHVVLNKSNTLSVCTQCGAYTVPAAVAEHVERAAAEVLLADLERPPGAVLKFARSVLGLTQAQLGEKLSIQSETISRWETNAKQYEAWLPLALRGLLSERPHEEHVILRKTA